MALATYTDFVKPYQDGYANGESGGTPVTAEILNTNYDAFLIALNTWAASVGLEMGNKVDKVTGKQLSDENYTSTEKTKLSGIAEGATAVVANPSESSSTNLTKIKIGGSVYLIPQGGSGGSSVTWTQIQQSGTKIATISIDGTDTDVYAPNGGSGGGDSVSWSQVVQSGTKIGTITINNVATDVYVPAVPTKTSDLTNDSNFVADASYVHTDNNYTTTEKNKLADLVQVEANPSSGTSAGDLSTISINGTKYDIPSSGGGGTTVVANPSGTATDELEKLQVGSTIYSIPEGGSGEGWIDIKGTLTAGQTSITLTSSKIKTTSVVDYHTSIFGVNPTAVTISNGSATLTFEAQATDMGVMVSVRKVSEEVLFNLPIPSLETNKIWFAYDNVREYTTVVDTQGDGLHIYGGESVSDWTTSGTICIDLNQFSSIIPATGLTAMKFHFTTCTLTDYAAVRFFISNTKYEGGQNSSDAMLRSAGFAQMESSDSTDSYGFYTASIDNQTLSGGRYLYIMAMTGSVEGSMAIYGNGYNGTFDIQVDGIDFVTGGNS